jgi:ferrous iron transport protein B
MNIRRIAIIGNPNCGKTTLFNELTGLRQKVGNYPGVTVEKKEGTVAYEDGAEVAVLDLPGTYSLSATSPDERVAVEILLGKLDGVSPPEGVVCVIDASNLERSLSLVSQIIDQRYPLIVALNMVDVAEREGMNIDIRQLSETLDVCVVPTVGSKKRGIRELKAAIAQKFRISSRARTWKLPQAVDEEHRELIALLLANGRLKEEVAFYEATMLLSTTRSLEEFHGTIPAPVIDHVCRDYRRLEQLGVDRYSVFARARHEWIRRICTTAISQGQKKTNYTDKIDAIVTHRFWGYVIFFALMMLMFQSIFTWATVPMDYIGAAFNWMGGRVETFMPPGDLRDLIVYGVISGAGAVITFLPQISLLFLFLGILEDTGYMARAAFIMDRVMNKVGLHGKSFIPILSSFACAIPGIMATRTIENPRDRLVTMLVAPLATCSARLPVYSLLIAAFIPATLVFGFWSLQGIVMISLYLLGIVSALLMAWLLKKTILKSKTPDFILEMPPYRVPSLKSVALKMWERSLLFLQRAGTIILGVSIVLWFLATYPKSGYTNPSQKLEHSFVGRAGRIIEPVIRPLGFDWKIGVGILSSLLQREVFVSTMSTIYNIQSGDDNSVSLKYQIQKDIDPKTGHPKFTILTAICLMVYYVLAMQCMSTLAVMRRETNGWKWPMFQLGYMTALAYIATFAVYRVGLYFM